MKTCSNQKTKNLNYHVGLPSLTDTLRGVQRWGVYQHICL